MASTKISRIQREKEDSLIHNIIGAAIEVHRSLSPRLLESAYELCLIYELRLRGINVKAQQILPIFYKDIMSIVDTVWTC